MNPLYDQLPTTIFETMSALARQHEAVNLGQGFPEIDGPLELREAAARSILADSNQYPPLRGLPELRQAVAEHYRREQALDLDWQEEVVVTSGGTEAIAASLLALISPGDEVLVFEPLYDAYLPLIARAGGIAKRARMEPPDFHLARAELERVFSDKTRLVVFNNPANPSARVYERSELELLAEFVERFDSYLISDEVWEQVVFDERRHHSVLGVPSLRARAVKIGSAGKMFSLTGWKVGFVCAAPRLARVIACAHQFLTFTTPPHLQRAVAFGLSQPRGHFSALVQELQRSRDRLAAGLAQTGFSTLPSQGSYFLLLDLAASGLLIDDATFCLRAVQEFRVAAIPLSTFYAADPVRHLVRLCFSKTDVSLDLAVERLGLMRRRLFAESS